MSKFTAAQALTLERLNGVAEGATPIEKCVLNPATSTATGNQDNYDLDALASAPQIGVSDLLWNGASGLTLRGLAGGLAGRLLWLQNITAAQTLTINHQDTNSTAANRIITATGAAVALTTGQSALLRYDATTARWRLFTFASTVTSVVAGGSSINAGLGGVIYQSTSAVGNVGAGEDDLIAQAIAANVLSVNGQRLVGRFAGTFAANGNVKRLKLKFGTTTIWDMSASYSPSGGQWVIDFSIVRTGATAQVGYAMYLGTIGHTLAAAAGRGAPAETLSGAVTLKVTGEATSNNDIVCDEFYVAWMPAP